MKSSARPSERAGSRRKQCLDNRERTAGRVTKCDLYRLSWSSRIFLRPGTRPIARPAAQLSAKQTRQLHRLAPGFQSSSADSLNAKISIAVAVFRAVDQQAEATRETRNAFGSRLGGCCGRDHASLRGGPGPRAACSRPRPRREHAFPASFPSRRKLAKHGSGARASEHSPEAAASKAHSSRWRLNLSHKKIRMIKMGYTVTAPAETFPLTTCGQPRCPESEMLD